MPARVYLLNHYDQGGRLRVLEAGGGDGFRKAWTGMMDRAAAHIAKSGGLHATPWAGLLIWKH